MADYPRKIHVVTAGYLRLFAHDGQVEVTDRIKMTTTRRKPENVGHRWDYWGPDRETARDAERSTADGENDALEVLRELPHRWPLKGNDRSIVAEFLALHYVRSPAFSRLLDVIQTGSAWTPSPRGRVGVRFDRIAGIASLMACMQWSLVTFDEVHIGTSDQPVVPVPRLGRGERLAGAAMAQRGLSDVTEIRFAITPRLLLLLTWLDELDQPEPLAGSPRQAADMNRSTFNQTDKQWYAQPDSRSWVQAPPFLELDLRALSLELLAPYIDDHVLTSARRARALEIVDEISHSQNTGMIRWVDPE